jgi:hypothetical protein
VCVGARDLNVVLLRARWSVASVRRRVCAWLRRRRTGARQRSMLDTDVRVRVVRRARVQEARVRELLPRPHCGSVTRMDPVIVVRRAHRIEQRALCDATA